MLVPQVVGFRLTGRLPDGSTATDLVLTVTQILRELGVVGKFVEYFGAGLVGLPVADRATIGNMSPEYGATCGFFPVDEETLAYLRLTGRDEEHVALVEAYCKDRASSGTTRRTASRSTPRSSSSISATVEPSIAGPRRPQDRVALRDAKESFLQALRASASTTATAADAAVAESFPASDPVAAVAPGHRECRRQQRSPYRTSTSSREPCGARSRANASARRRRGRHRRHHELHEHVEPAGDGRRRPAREEGGRARPRRDARG